MGFRKDYAKKETAAAVPSGFIIHSNFSGFQWRHPKSRAPILVKIKPADAFIQGTVFCHYSRFMIPFQYFFSSAGRFDENLQWIQIFMEFVYKKCRKEI